METTPNTPIRIIAGIAVLIGWLCTRPAMTQDALDSTRADAILWSHNTRG